MRLSSSILLLTLALATPALADRPAGATTLADYELIQTETVIATVRAINLKTRHATLRLPDGKKQTFAVDPRVQNLDKVKRGDQVVVQYKNAIEVELTTPDPTRPLPLPTRAFAVDDRTGEGGKPEGVVAQTMTLTGTVQSYDPESRLAVIDGSDGETVKVNVQHPDQWTQVKKGDVVTARFSEALAIAVQAPPPQIPKTQHVPAPAR